MGPRAPPTVKVSRIQHGQHDAFVVRSCHLYCGLDALPLGPAASPSSPFLYCGSSYLQFCITITFKGKDHFPAAAIEECPDWGGSAVRGGMSSPTIRRGFSARARSPLPYVFFRIRLFTRSSSAESMSLDSPTSSAVCAVGVAGAWGTASFVFHTVCGRLLGGGSLILTPTIL